MWTMSSPCLVLATIVVFVSLHQGVTGQVGCNLVVSPEGQHVPVRIGSTGEVTCQISPACNLTNKRVRGPFWRRKPGGEWFVPNMRMSNPMLSPTKIALRYTHIIHEDLGLYVCVARIGKTRLNSTIFNITERTGNKGDVNVTPGPDRSTDVPRKRRSAEGVFKSHVGVGLVRAAPPRRNYRMRRVARRPPQGPTRVSGQEGNPQQPDDHPAAAAAVSKYGFEQLAKTPCDEEEKLFSKTGLIIVASLVCSTFLLLYMVVLLMAVPRICFPYYPKKNNNTRQDERNAVHSKDKGSSGKVAIPLSIKVRPNGRSDSGIESVDGLEERGSHHGGGRTGSHWEIGTDRLEEFYRRTTNQETGSDEDMLSGLKMYNIEKNMPRRGRSESVPVTPYRYQSSIYVKV